MLLSSLEAHTEIKTATFICVRMQQEDGRDLSLFSCFFLESLRSVGGRASTRPVSVVDKPMFLTIFFFFCLGLFFRNGPIILTGFSALNKLLGREVYTSQDQLGGPQVCASERIAIDFCSPGVAAAVYTSTPIGLQFIWPRPMYIIPPHEIMSCLRRNQPRFRIWHVPPPPPPGAVSSF